MFDLIFRRFFSNKRVQAAFLQFTNLWCCDAVPLPECGNGIVQAAFGIQAESSLHMNKPAVANLIYSVARRAWSMSA